MTPDSELLGLYAEQGDEASFAEVVRRHVNWVYSTALRLTAGDAHLAEDVAQGVFTDLARKARALSRHPALGGWLHTATRFAATKAVARESARRVREQEASAMQTNSTASEISWEQLRPVLDEAIGRLAERDRNIVVLRFFEGKSHREVGDLLGLSEDTARKRTERAIDKLRSHFNRRGVTVSTGLLIEAVDVYSVQAAPAEWAAQLPVTAITGVTPVTGGIMILRTLFMTTTAKITIAVSVIAIAIVSYHYLARGPEISTVKIAGAISQSKLTALAQVALPKQSPVSAGAEEVALGPEALGKTGSNMVVMAGAAFPAEAMDRNEAMPSPLPAPSTGEEKAAQFVKVGVNAPLLAFSQNTGSYPTTAEGLQALLAQPAGNVNWRGPYLIAPDALVDPWGNPYQYAFPGPHNGMSKPDIWSMGPDGISGTKDDIVNW